MIDIVRERSEKFDPWRNLKSVPIFGIASGPACVVHSRSPKVRDPSIPPVVDHQAQNELVFGAHDAVHKAQPHSVRNHHRRARADLAKPAF